MDTTAPLLFEFVPARLAEDEALAHTPRERAEVQAKRERLALASRADLVTDAESEAILGEIAEAYADHPDYDRAIGHVPA